MRQFCRTGTRGKVGAGGRRGRNRVSTFTISKHEGHQIADRLGQLGAGAFGLALHGAQHAAPFDLDVQAANAGLHATSPFTARATSSSLGWV